MSDHLPLEIQTEIIKRLPVKSLNRSKLVSKPWKSLIESSEFINDYNVSQTSPHHLFIRYDNPYEQSEDLKYATINDNDNHKTFPQHNFAPTDLLESFKLLKRKPRLIGSCHGLFCFHGEYHYGTGGSYPNKLSEVAIIWNPVINKSIAVNMLVWCDYFPSRISFGVRPDTCDPMIVRIQDPENVCWQFEVFKLSTRNWKVLCSNLPRKSIRFTESHVSVNRFIYWKTFDKSGNHHTIVSFDMKTESFAEVNVSDYLASKSFSISKIRESLALLEYRQEVDKGAFCTIWMMIDDGFKKLYTINTASLWTSISGFRKCGKPVVKTTIDDESWLLQVYEPRSESMNGLGIYVKHPYFFVCSYVETLILLNHPCSHGKHVKFEFVNQD